MPCGKSPRTHLLSFIIFTVLTVDGPRLSLLTAKAPSQSIHQRKKGISNSSFFAINAICLGNIDTISGGSSVDKWFGQTIYSLSFGTFSSP